MIKYIQARLANPFFVMAAVVILFIIKAGVKIWIGLEVNSMVIKGDGFHNVADIMQNFIIIIVLYIATRPRSQEYSMGRGNLEFLASLTVSLMLMFVALDFIRESLGGLAHSFHFIAVGFQTIGSVLSFVPYAGPWLVDLLAVKEMAPPSVAGPLFPYVLAVTVGSIVVSRIACHYQIKVGKTTGHAVVSAAGEETRADARIEFVTLIGIISEKMFPSYPFVEYAFALFVAFVIGRTAKELFSEAWEALSTKSIGLEIDEQLRRICLNVPGVTNVVTLGTFRVGPLAVVKVTLNGMRRRSMPVLTEVIEEQLKNYVVKQGFVECQVDVTFKRPLNEANHHRIAYAVVCSAEREIVTIAATAASATHILVADMEFDEIKRSTLDPVPADSADYLRRKRAREFYVFDEETERASWQSDGVELKAAASYLPAAAGLIRKQVELSVCDCKRADKA